MRSSPIVPKVGRIRYDELMADLKVEYDVNRRRSKDSLKRRIDLYFIPFGGDQHYYGQPRHSPTAGVKVQNNHQSRTGCTKRAFSMAMKAGKLLSRPYILMMLQDDNVRR
jgi:hypothetical protein